MWTFTEYAPATNAWGVRAGQFKAPPPAHPSLASTPPCGTSTTVTINGTSTNHSEFFEPGLSYRNHLAVSVSGPSTVAVSNVLFVSPLQVTATFNLSGAVTGSYKVYVTNPDGQKDSTSFTLSTSCPVSAALVTAKNITEESTGINSKSIIYPNPSHDVINVNNKKGGKITILLMDDNSHILQKFSSSSTTLKINVSNLASGSYIIKIFSGNKAEVQKFIKN